MLPDVNFASLIGRLGESGTPFFVGSSFGPSGLGGGRLFLQGSSKNTDLAESVIE